MSAALSVAVTVVLVHGAFVDGSGWKDVYEKLTKKGYDVNYSWGMGVHGHDMGGAMLPEMMRWLWRDQPVSVDPNDKVERSFRAKK